MKRITDSTKKNYIGKKSMTPMVSFLVLFIKFSTMVASIIQTDGDVVGEHESSDSISNTITIGIAGGTGAGKTTLAQAVYSKLKKEENIAYLTHDNYYKDISHLSYEERSKTNFDHPDSLDTDLLIQHVKDLKEGKTVNVPVYDFTTHSRLKDEVLVVKPKRIILVEGILIFSDQKLVELLDLKVFVVSFILGRCTKRIFCNFCLHYLKDADSDVRLIRRISRDVAERGRSIDSIMDQYTNTVRPMHNMFVEPSKKVADVIVHDGTNPVVLDMICHYLMNVSDIEKTCIDVEDKQCSKDSMTNA